MVSGHRGQIVGSVPRAQAPEPEVINSGAKLGRDNKWYIGEHELVFAALAAIDAPEILRNLDVLGRVCDHLGLPPVLAYVSNVTAMVYLSWLDLERVASHYQDPHIGQYAGTWSRITGETLRQVLADESWRPDPRRRPLSVGYSPGWDHWKAGTPVPWHLLNGTLVVDVSNSGARSDANG